MRRVFTMALVMVLVLAVAPAVAAKQATVVQGTNTAPDDLAAVQAAVDRSGQVILEGVFDFGSGTLEVDGDVVLRGRHGATIRNGGVALDTPAIAIVPPATAVTVRDLAFENSADVSVLAIGTTVDVRNNTMKSPGFGGVLVIGSSGSTVRGNTVTESVVGILVESASDADIRNNTIEAEDVGIFLFATSGSTFANNTVSIVGSSTGFFGIGRTGVFLAPDGAPNSNNTFKNTTFRGEMTYGYVLGEESLDNAISISPRNLDAATFVVPPFFGPCGNGPGDPDPSGAAVVLVAASFFGPAAEGNDVKSRAKSATILDCGIDNEIH